MAFGHPRIRDWTTTTNRPRLFLRSARRALNMSVRDLAKAAHFSPGYISSAENGERDLSVECAKKLASVLMMKNWWDLCETFRHEAGEGCTKFIGDNGTVFIIPHDLKSTEPEFIYE